MTMKKKNTLTIRAFALVVFGAGVMMSCTSELGACHLVQSKDPDCATGIGSYYRNIREQEKHA